MITIISLHRRTFPDGAIYVGRRTPQLAGSPLANPFKLTDESQRSKILAQYEAWLKQRLGSPESSQSIELDRLTALAAAGDLVLACWCFPKDCHADIVKLRIEEKLQEASYVPL